MQKKMITTIQKALLVWYGRDGREGLPWRETTDLYKITVSEIMLQQTNVPKVIEKYTQFLKRFPTVGKLARARQSTVLKAWQGLGYNRRALNLHKMAKVIVTEYGGTFPETAAELQKLPGIGPYTSKAILAFGRNQDVSAVDVNIDRVMRRLHGLKKWRGSDDTEKIIARFLPRGRSRDWHNALMDLGSTLCTKRNVRCAACPLQKVCTSYPDPQDFVIAKKKEIGRHEHGKHIPRRIYRGRIIEFLREQRGTTLEIGKLIKKDWDGRKDKKWLEDILRLLAKEKMIVQKMDQWHLK